MALRHAGAGAGIAKKFAEHQYKVALVSRNTEALAGVESDIKKAGGTAISVVADTGGTTSRQLVIIQYLVVRSNKVIIGSCCVANRRPDLVQSHAHDFIC